MPYQEMTEGELETLFPQLGWGAKQAPLVEVLAVIDTVGLYLAKDHPVYNPERLRADRDFVWGHVSQTGNYPGGSYVDHQICVKSLRTGKMFSSGVSLVLNNYCQTYMVELTNISKM